jgi:hypothetical protein
MHNAPRFKFHDDENVDGYKEQTGRGGEITGPDFMSVILEEGAPVLT